MEEKNEELEHRVEEDWSPKTLADAALKAARFDAATARKIAGRMYDAAAALEQVGPPEPALVLRWLGQCACAVAAADPEGSDKFAADLGFLFVDSIQVGQAVGVVRRVLEKVLETSVGTAPASGAWAVVRAALDAEPLLGVAADHHQRRLVVGRSQVRACGHEEHLSALVREFWRIERMPWTVDAAGSLDVWWDAWQEKESTHG